MTGRRRWLFTGIGWSTWLLSGCLFHNGAEAPLPLTGSSAAGSSEQAVPADRDLASLPPPPPPPPASDYRVTPATPASLAGSGGDKVERVALSRPSDPDSVRPAPPPESVATSVPLPATVTAGPAAPAEKPARPDSPLLAALRCALEKHPKEAQDLLAKYDKADRQLLLALVKLTAGVSEGDLEQMPAAELAAALDQLHALSASLKKHAPLALENLGLCRRIEGFGRFDPVPAGHAYQAGSAGLPGERVQVYVEVRNFLSRQHQGQYQTILDSTLEVHDAQRRPVATMKLGDCLDRTHTPRQDYFLNFQFQVPAALKPGLYTLWVTVRDVTDGKTESSTRVARRSLDFRVRPATEAARAD